MNKTRQNRERIFLKIAAIVLCGMIVLQLVNRIGLNNIEKSDVVSEPNNSYNFNADTPIEIHSVPTDEGMWYGIEGFNVGTPVESHVVISDTTGITVVANFNGFWLRLDNTTNMPGATSMKQTGKPDLPRLINYLEIPYEVNVTLEVLYGVPHLIEGYYIEPSSEPLIPILNVTQNIDTIQDDTVYGSNGYFPDYNVSMEGEAGSSPIIMRGRRLFELSFYPVQYSPGLSNLLYYPKLVVKLNYDRPAQIEPVPLRLLSEPFEKLFEGFLKNYNQWDPETGTGPGFSPPTYCTPALSFITGIPVSADYLIITHPTFKPYCDKLAEWKTRKGLLTEVVTTAEILVAYPTLTLQEGIKKMIQDAYDTGSVGPTYVLLFGDSEFVPNGYGMVHPARMENITEILPHYEMDENYRVPGSFPAEYYIFDQNYGKIGTDSVYFTVHGNDYFPDIIHGRVSVDTATEAETAVEKILSYEIAPPDNPDFYKNILGAANFIFYDPPEEPDVPNLVQESNGYKFVRYAEDIRFYLNGTPFNYVTHLNYSADTTQGTPAEFSDIDFTDPQYDHLLQVDWIKPYSDSGAGNLTLNINSDEGRFLVFYNDHGDSMNMVWPCRIKRSINPTSEWQRSLLDGWSAPKFNISDIPDLNNGALLPFIISSACSTGWFDNDIDQEEYALGSRFDSISEMECFAENITRMANGGAIAVIAASRPSWSLASGDMLNGIITALWPGYLQWSNEPIYGMGAALLFGKINTASVWGYEDYDIEDYEKFLTKVTFQEYHLFGDPETQLWTSSPSDLAVSYPTQVSTYGPQQFVVTVMNQTEPVYHAKVCIQGEDVYNVRYTDEYGQVLFAIDTSSLLPLNVTVTKHNFIPHLGEIEVINCVASITIDPNIGLEGDTVTVTLTDFEGADVRHVYYNETELVVSSQNTIVIPNGREGCANIKANDSDEVALCLFTRYHGGPPVDPYVYCQNDRSTWHLAGDRLTYDNPSIEVWEGNDHIDSHELKQFTSYTVKVNVSNNLPVEIDDVTVTLAWAMFSVGREWTSIDGPQYTGEIDPLSFAIVEFDWFTGNTGHICLNATLHHFNDVNIVNNFGQENTDVAKLESPGDTWLLVGNPTDENKSVYLEVRQQCSITSIWSAKIIGLSYQDIQTKDYENVTLQITSPPGTGGGEMRLFTVSLYIDGEYIGGASILGLEVAEPTTPTMTPTTTTTPYTTTTTTTEKGLDIADVLGIAGGATVIIIIIVFIWKKRYR